MYQNAAERSLAAWLANTDKGFDYNVGRMAYKPNLDLYPETLAYQFAKQEMSGDSFKLDYEVFQQAFEQGKQELDLTGRLTEAQLREVREFLRKEFKFAAGVLTAKNKAQLNSTTATVWLSDDTLIKQFSSREGQNFGIEEYAVLPELIYEPVKMINTREKHYQLVKQINGKKYSVVLKILGKEIFIQSFRKLKDREWEKIMTAR